MEGWQIDSNVDSKNNIPILAEVDVLVIGAGAAGVAAATTAAELGLETIIVESYGFPGGAAVAGLSGSICGLFASVSDIQSIKPDQLVFGFAERFRKELERRNGITPPQMYGHTLAVTHDPLVWREAGDAFLINSGVRVLYHTFVTDTLVEDGVVTGVQIYSKIGHSLIKAKRLIDASGDAVVVTRAGFKSTFGDRGIVQNPTMAFRMTNVNIEAFLEYWGEDTISPPHVVKLLEKAEEQDKLNLPRKHIWIFPTPRPNEILVNATRISAPDGRELNPLDPEDHTIAEIDGRKQVRSYATFIKKYINGCQDAYVVDTGVEAGIRQTRSILGIKTLTNSNVVNAEKQSEGIVRSAWPIELHSGSKPKLHWLTNDYYEIPYGALVPEVGENIIVAGRCLSAEHEAMASARVTAQCFELGRAAAIATDISLNKNIQYRKISGIEVSKLMKL